LEEDSKKNRMHESLQLFSDVIQERCFNKKNIILFFNKEDVFKKKIQNVDLNVCWDEYKGKIKYNLKDGKKYDPALKFITKKFVNANQNKKRFPLINKFLEVLK
jgi:hypothetical protein